MGAGFSGLRDNGSLDCSTGRKRKHNELDEIEDEDSDCNSPARKQLKPTARYIYESLFEHGVQSDITVLAVGPNDSWRHQWLLHKMFLRQAGYFDSMFSGRWAENENTTELTIHIVDVNIDIEGLNTAFASLYCDDYDIDVSNLVSVIAAATMLQIDGLLTKSVAVVEKHINNTTVANLCQSAAAYGHRELEDKCILWLERHILTKLGDEVLLTLPCSLLKRIIASPTLFVVHIELDVYVLCRKWLYVQIRPEEARQVLKTTGDLAKESAEYFKSQASECAFLELPQGAMYADIFSNLRLRHIVNDNRNVRLLEKENIIPHNWLKDAYQQCWFSLLCGGQSEFDDAAFDNSAVRCGRLLDRNRQLTWRWTGFSFGIDLLVTYTPAQRIFSLKRNTAVRPSSYHNANSLCCLYDSRKIKFRLSVASFGDQGEEKAFKSSGIREYGFGMNEEIVVIRIDDDVEFPLFVSLQVLVQGIEGSS